VSLGFTALAAAAASRRARALRITTTKIGALTMRIAAAAGVLMLASAFFSVPCPSRLDAQAVDWPAYGPLRDLPALSGYANALPDLVGPVDGSARLTIFTEGNHYPVLLPIVLEEFPAWCKKTQRCEDLSADRILVLTLPQVMIVEALTKGGLRFGNAILPIGPTQKVFPEIVMGGAGPLRRLAAAELIQPRARVFARHRGMGLLIRREVRERTLESFATQNAKHRLIIATPFEAGARRQYENTLSALLGPKRSKALLDRDIGDFAGRLRIQHRDVPYALLNDLADGGLIFGHLADFLRARLSRSSGLRPGAGGRCFRSGDRARPNRARRKLAGRPKLSRVFFRARAQRLSRSRLQRRRGFRIRPNDSLLMIAGGLCARSRG
jgi:hypothetical protein